MSHEHAWGRPVKLNFVDGFNGPVDVYDCACGVRRVMRRGDHPDKPVCDVRDVAYKHLQSLDNWTTIERTGGGLISPAMWLTEQEAKNG